MNHTTFITVILTAAITAAIVFIIEEFRHARFDVEEEFNRSEINECKKSVLTIINSCRTAQQALCCKQLINLFHSQFHNRENFEAAMEELWDRLDVKYRVLTEIGLSEMTVESLIK